MQRLNGAFRFIDQNFRMAQRHEAIQKPWMYFTLGGLLLTLLWLLPLGGLILGLGSKPFAWILAGVILVLYLACLVVWGEVTTLRTAQIFITLVDNNKEQEESGSVWGLFRKNWVDVYSYVLSVPGLTLMIFVQDVLHGQPPAESAWMKVHPLIPPILALEGIGLKAAVKRVREIVGGNLLRFQPGYLPVSFISGAFMWLAVLIGAAAGWFTAGWIAEPLFTGSWRAFFAVSAGVGVMGIFSMTGIAFSTYFRICYHTALYLWALKVEGAQNEPQEGLASPPEILSQAMKKQPKQRKDGSDAAET